MRPTAAYARTDHPYGCLISTTPASIERASHPIGAADTASAPLVRRNRAPESFLCASTHRRIASKGDNYANSAERLPFAETHL